MPSCRVLHIAVFYKLVHEPGADGVDIKVNVKMSDFDIHLKKMIEVLKRAGLVFRYTTIHLMIE